MRYSEILLEDDSESVTTVSALKKSIVAYKLFRQKNGNLYPLFIGKNTPTPVGVWIPAEFIPTKGYAERPGWHSGVLPMAPHLRTAEGHIASDRVWARVRISADVNWQPIADQSKTKDIRDKIPLDGYYKFKTSKMQGGAWYISGSLKIEKVLSDDEVSAILLDSGHFQDSLAERHVDKQP